MTRSEGEQLLGAARDVFRVRYSQTENLDEATRLFQAEVRKGDFDGKYYGIVDEVKHLDDGRIQLKTSNHDDKLEVGVIRFNLEDGRSEVEWFNRDPD